MSDILDIKFYIQDEATISRCLVPMHNILKVGFSTISNFSGSAGGGVYEVVFVEPIVPFCDFHADVVYMNQEMFDRFKQQYIAAAYEKTDVSL